MTDQEAIEYLEELKEYNRNDKLIIPDIVVNGGHFDTFYQCAFDHAIRALNERIERMKNNE